MTLESQYKEFKIRNPESKFTFDEWKNWKFSRIGEAMIKLKQNIKHNTDETRK